MKNRVTEWIAGLLFGFGLILSGMTDPGKVLGFLDLLGIWDPSLMCVMAGAIMVGYFAFSIAKTRTQSLLGGRLYLPLTQGIDPPLVIGAMLFGAGWGLAGFCPGPAIVSLASGHLKAAAFVVFMMLGMWLSKTIPSVIRRYSQSPSESSE